LSDVTRASAGAQNALMLKNGFILLLIFTASLSAQDTKATKVSIRDDGIFLVNGKPFFPIGIWLYELNTNVMADIHEHRFNTVIGNGFGPSTLDQMHKHGLMAVPMHTEEFFKAGVNHPALLAWYLHDEPESGPGPEKIKAAYQALKAKDANHPIGLNHYLFEALEKFKEGCDFTMTDVYPIVAARDGIIQNVGVFIDQARRVHNNANWPHGVFIQDFGGPKTDGGKWAQPLPHEVRCMVFIALVHRTNAIHYFSFWPQAPATWDSITDLNKELERLTPWLVAKGQEVSAQTSDKAIQARAKKIGDKWMILAVNTEPRYYDATLTAGGLGAAELSMPFENRSTKAVADKIADRFAPFAEHVYLVGSDPQ
jgi:hypothetical protein